MSKWLGVEKKTCPNSHLFYLMLYSHAPAVLSLGGFLARVSGQLDSRIVVTEGRQFIFVFRQQRDDKSGVVEYAYVRSQRWRVRQFHPNPSTWSSTDESESGDCCQLVL